MRVLLHHLPRARTNGASASSPCRRTVVVVLHSDPMEAGIAGDCNARCSSAAGGPLSVQGQANLVAEPSRRHTLNARVQHKPRQHQCSLGWAGGQGTHTRLQGMINVTLRG